MHNAVPACASLWHPEIYIASQFNSVAVRFDKLMAAPFGILAEDFPSTGVALHYLGDGQAGSIRKIPSPLLDALFRFPYDLLSPIARPHVDVGYAIEVRWKTAFSVPAYCDIRGAKN